jgi:hypothetical protein
MGEWLLSRRDGRSHCQSQEREQKVLAMAGLFSGISLLKHVFVSFYPLAEIRSIVPLGRCYFPHDSRHFVPGYNHAVPPGQNTFARQGLA